MREILLLASILLGQLAPNSPILPHLQKSLLIKPTTPATETLVSGPVTIVAAPIKLTSDSYAANAQGVYSIDLTSNKVLAAKDINKRLQIASLTKLMTTYVILKSEPNLEKVYVVPALSGQDGDALMGLITGEEVAVKALLSGILLNSGSDAAQTLAIGNAGSVSTFVSKMNTVATELGLTNTHFSNPVGWDDTNNYSSAKDLIELTRILLRNKTFSEIITKKNLTVATAVGRPIALTTTNQLLYNPGYVGVKTGFTNGAGECLISLYKSGNTEILTAVIGSGNRFGDTESIKGWILEHFSW